MGIKICERGRGVKSAGAAATVPEGEVLGREAPVKRDSDGFADRLRDFVSDAIVTDGLSMYKPVVERLGVERPIRAALVKKRVWNRLDKTDG